jgi:hypothetical protein
MGRQVTNLTQYILDFVNAVRRRPAIGSDPSELDSLEQAALTSFQGAFGALNAPIAAQTWEARTLFLGANAVSEKVNLDIPFPCMIVGAYCSISTLIGAGGAAPTLNDIDVSIDLDAHEYLTSAQGTTTPIVAAPLQKDGTFVTLAALSTGAANGARLLGWVIANRTAQLGFTWRWTQGGGVFANSHVKVALFTRALQDQ